MGVLERLKLERVSSQPWEVPEMRFDTACVTLLVLASSATGFGQTPKLDSPRPIDIHETVWLEELTWMEVRDLIKDGTTTIIVSTGGIEQNGPYLATGKHNYVLRATCPAIAGKLGNALCAPIIPFVPEGDIEPPTGMMRFPGTISVTDETYRALLTDIASSLKQHGFEHIIFIGDSGGNQDGMKAVTSELSAAWAGSKTAIHYIPEFYDYPGLWKWAGESFGWKEEREGLHDDPTISSMMMTVDPNLVRIKEREAKGKASINGISLLPVDKAVEAGRKIVEHRAEVTAAAIRKAVDGASANPRIGKWKNKNNPTNILTYEALTGGGMKVIVDGVNRAGEKSQWSYTTMLDGKDAVVTGDSNRDSAAVTPVDGLTSKIVYKKDGKASQIAMNTVSKDGKTLTVTFTTPEGEQTAVAVYEKMP